MKYKTLFRVMLKLLGVFFAVGAINSIITHVAQMVSMLSLQGFPTRQIWYFGTAVFGPIVEFGVGLYLFFGGKWIIDKAIPSNRPYCHECGYDLTGAIGDVCNECGTPFRGPPFAKTHE